eukprot:TRINITY_DN47254_c0_g1_i1.p1 TRINITY_DN47254_c0_g1~~TRINITY_DN47254_c0_g1_i1.p1  ORF type:complete len:720 (-),score=112.43 TRINITY_DN47254_c0_g1_i1:47-2143(-)
MPPPLPSVPSSTQPSAAGSIRAILRRHAGGGRRLPAALVLAFLLLRSPAGRRASELVRSLLRSFVLLFVRATRPVRKDFLCEGAESPGLHTESDARSSAPQVRAGGGFADYNRALPSWLAEALARQGFSTLKPIQRAVLPLALRGKDLVGVAPTGSGKTLAFLVPAIVHANGQPPPRRVSDGPIALVLAPTRELAIQIGGVADGLLRNGGRGRTTNLTSIVLYGGSRRADQLQMLRAQRVTHIMVATPGRLLDFIRNFNAFSLKLVSFFVLDEGDRMLDFGFEEDILAISQMIRSDRQMLFFSATWPAEVEESAKRLCGRGAFAYRVTPGDADLTHETRVASDEGLALPPPEIRQIVEVVLGSSFDRDGGMRKKLPLLLRHLDTLGLSSRGGPSQSWGNQTKVLIFVQTRRAAEEIGEVVATHCGLSRCGVMHGARRQEQREATLQAFRDGRLQAVVATDVVGRGVDIPGVTHVVIFDFPDDMETYVHRVGRTGRNGAAGTSIAFFEPVSWLPDLATELAHVLRSCGQDVPADLQLEEELARAACNTSSAWQPTTLSDITACTPEKVDVSADGEYALATASELGCWDAHGARMWAYSANGGESEQGRLQFCAGGKLRTTWTWGEWHLEEAMPDALPTADDAEKLPSKTWMSLSWGGVTDVVALDASGLNFELITRNGRPARTFKKRTLGRALPMGAAL